MAKLPARVVGGYWPYWNGPKLSDIPSEYNLIYLFSARPVGGQPGSTGAVFWEQGQQSAASFKTDLAARRKAGSAVIMSICGAGEYLRLDTRARTTAFVNSLKQIYTDLGGFDGLDWNIESTDVWPAEMVWASQQLKAAYGNDFAITYPPAPWRTQDQGVARALAAAGVLDLVAPQYYDLTGLNSEQAKIDHAVNNLSTIWLPIVGGDASKLGIGFKNVGATSETMTVASCLKVWNTMAAKNTAMRGVFVWELAADRQAGNQFAGGMAKTVMQGVPVTPPPDPTPTPPDPTKPPANSTTYVIKAGDTFSSIATALGVTVSEVMALNPGVAAESLEVGQTIYVPAKSSPVDPPKPPVPTDVQVTMKPAKKGDRGENVKTVQGALVARGYAPAGTIKPDQTVDGVFGAGTETAVKKFQKAVQLTQDGVVAGDTWKKLLGS